MQPLRPSGEFPFTDIRSRGHENLLPEQTLRYLELEREDSFDIGVHRIHRFKILERQHVQDGQTLAHIHSVYAQWRDKMSLETEYYWR